MLTDSFINYFINYLFIIEENYFSHRTEIYFNSYFHPHSSYPFLSADSTSKPIMGGDTIFVSYHGG